MKNLQVLQLIRLLFQLMKFVKDIQNVTSFDMVQVSSRLFQFVNVDILLNHSTLELYRKKTEYFLTKRECECMT